MKIIRRPWSKEERDWLINQVVNKHTHPYDAWIEYNQHAGFKKRTYPAIKSLLKDSQISYAGLLKREDARAEILLTGGGQRLTEEEMRKELSKLGYKVEKQEEAKTDKRFKIDVSMFKGETIKLGVISCTQLGSKYQQLTYLKNFYKYAEDQGVRIIVHCGDVVDGEKMYRGHEYELFLHGAKAQKDYTIQHYPRLDNGGKTHMIMGQHDESFWKHNGIDVLEDIAKEREDIIYHGRWGAYPKIGNLNIYMAHGTGGVCYARTYRLQRNIEQFSPAQKPDLYFLGHFHVSTALFMYRNVVAFMIPCFQSQTPYLKAKGLYPEIGGFIMEIVTNDTFRKDGIARFKWEYVPFFVPIEWDY